MNCKQIVAYPHNRLRRSKKMELTIDTFNNIDKSENNYNELKKL